MNNTITTRHNERVKPTDTVYFLGDFCFKNTKSGKKGEGEIYNAEYYINKLNGRFVFIKGNHDRNNSLKTILTNAVIQVGKKRLLEIYLVHDPKDFHEGYRINLVAHIHEKWLMKKVGNSILYNVGVDKNDFRPITINHILDKISKFKKEGKHIE